MASHKDNPWNEIRVKDYELHMGHPNVAQLQTLNGIIREQIEIIPKEQRATSEIAILGITDGNGLEHIEPMQIKKAVGIDINQEFLDVCQQRYGYLKNRLSLWHIDLINEKEAAIAALKESALIIANLLIEHIHLYNFIEIISGLPKHDQLISCVIQHNPDGALASTSGFEHAFDKVLPIVEEANEQNITQSMKDNGYSLQMRKVYVLPNKKQFIRLDYCL